MIKELAKNKNAVTERTILQIHSLILQGIDKSNTGVYRKVPVYISGSKHVPPQPYLVPSLMENLMLWYNENKDTMHPVQLSARMHQRLVSIHPFIDGNGRTSRLLMNLILLQNDFPIAILKGDLQSRLEYYNALELARTDKNNAVFVDFIISNVTQMMGRILSTFE